MKIILLSISILLFKLSFGQTPGFKLFLIGDTGEDKCLELTMDSFLDTISMYPNSATVILGDNCYKGLRRGFDGTPVTIKRLGAQLDGLNSRKIRGSVYFVPGNHEWWNVTNMKKGKRHLKMNQSFIESNLCKNEFIKNKNNPFMPMNGDPIAAADLNDNQLKLIFLDTQWLLIQKSDIEKDKVYSQLGNILSDAISRKQKIVVAAHHPIYTLGKHSKTRRWQFPRVWKGQDIYHPIYNTMKTRISNTLSHNVDPNSQKPDLNSPRHYPIIYASGHDHMLEYFREDSVHYIVSGSGSKSSQFDKKKDQDFNPTSENGLRNQIAKVHEGYFEVDYTGNKVIIRAVLKEGIELRKQLIE